MDKKAFTLIELVIGVGVLLMTILGLLAVYNQSLVLNTYSRGHTLALQSVQGKMEEMRDHTYSQLVTDYGGAPGNTFNPAGLNGKGVIFLDNVSVPGITSVRIIVCWKEKERLFGEDTNLNGALDGGEDRNGNGLLDSPVEIVSYLTNSS